MMVFKIALFNLVWKISLLTANDATSGCEKASADLIINTNETNIEKRIGDSVLIGCKFNDSTDEHRLRWEHLFGIQGDVRRVFAKSSITLSNISYLDTGTYRCTDTTDRCLKKEVRLNIRGAPFMIGKSENLEMNEKRKRFTLEIISFPFLDPYVAVRLCNKEIKGTIYNVTIELGLITVSLDNKEYSIGGYLLNLTLEDETLTENGLYCVDISNEYGKKSFPFYENRIDSTEKRTLLLFLEENMTAISLGGLGLLSLIFTFTIIVMCRKLKTVENKRLSKVFNSMTQMASFPPSHSFKLTQLSNSFFPDPVPCQTGTFTTRSIQLRDRIYDPNGIAKNIPGRMDSRVYSFGQSVPDEYEDNF